MTKKITDESDIIDIGASDVEDISELERDIEEQMNTIFMEVGQDSRDEQFQLRVYKVLEKTGERANCFAALPSEMAGLMERIQKGYGAGLYEFWMYKNKRIYRRFKQHILEPRKVVDHAATVKNDMNVMVSAMIESNKQQFVQLKELMLMQGQHQQPVQPAFNPMEMMQGMAAMMASMQSMIPKPESQGNQFDTFMRAAEFIKDINPVGGGESNLFDTLGKAVDKFGPGLVDMTTKIAEAKANQPIMHNGPQPLQPPATTSTPQYPSESLDAETRVKPMTVPTEDENMISMQKLMFKKYVDILCGKAREGADAGLYSDLILDNWNMLPTDFADRLINDPTVIEDFVDLNPQVNNFRPWFITLLDGLKGPDVEEENEPRSVDFSGDHGGGVTILRNEPEENIPPLTKDDNEGDNKMYIKTKTDINAIPSPLDATENTRRSVRD